jgi:hypothetical protein
MKKRAGLPYFILAVAVVIIALKIMNWAPLAVQKGSVRRYESVEAVRSALSIKDIYVPSYFPQEITWPPSLILAQSRPFVAVMMRFTRANRRDTALIISQSEGRELSVEQPFEITTTTETVPFTMHGANAVLVVGTCSHGETCSMISWPEGKYYFTVAMKAPPFELAKIAESMHP